VRPPREQDKKHGIGQCLDQRSPAKQNCGAGDFHCAGHGRNQLERLGRGALAERSLSLKVAAVTIDAYGLRALSVNRSVKIRPELTEIVIGRGCVFKPDCHSETGTNAKPFGGQPINRESVRLAAWDVARASPPVFRTHGQDARATTGHQQRNEESSRRCEAFQEVRRSRWILRCVADERGSGAETSATVHGRSTKTPSVCLPSQNDRQRRV
jgi:hypothetical protein